MTTRGAAFEVTATNILLRKRRCSTTAAPNSLVALVVQPEDQLALGVTKDLQQGPEDSPQVLQRPQTQQCLPKPVTGCFCKTETLHDD
jgi:hypothetical protein